MGRKLRAAVAAAALCLLVFQGCGRGRPETSPVSGHVTYGGKPVPSGRIVFYPGHGRSAMGTIEPDGSYRLTTFDSGDGALLGRHRVTIEATRIVRVPLPKSLGEESQFNGVAANGLGVLWLVPETYSRFESTPLTADVSRGKNTIDFNLIAEPAKLATRPP
jgi:hypothetical protein